MALRCFLFPADGVSTVDEDGNPFPASGLRVQMTPFYEEATRDGLLVRRDPASVTALTQPAVYSPSQLASVAVNLTTTTINRDGERRVVDGYYASGDLGAGAEYRGVIGDTTTADNFIVWEAPNGRWFLVWDGRTLYAGHAGMRADVAYITDGVRSAGQLTLTSATANFTETARAGMRVLINEPSDPCTGTVALGAGGHALTGTGTNFLSIPRESFDTTLPSTGGAVWVGTEMYVVRYISSDTAAIVHETLPAGSGLTLYKETQTEAVIVSVDSATQVTLDVAATVSSAGLTAAYGSDNDDAIDLFDQVCHDNDVREARYPAGHIGFYDNHNFGADNAIDLDWQAKRRRNRVYIGAGYDRTVFSRLRKVSWEVAYPPDKPGALCWWLPLGVTLRGFSLTDNVPTLGVRHSTGGVGNASGGRAGIMMRHPYECVMEEMGGYGYCARDEYLYMDSSYEVRGNQFRNCYVPMANGNAINPNSGYLAGTVVTGCDAGSFFSALNLSVQDGICTGNKWRGQTDIITGNDVVVLEAAAKLIFADNVVETANMADYSSSGVTVFGSLSSAARVMISNLRIRDITALWNTASSGGALSFVDFAGVALVQGLQVAECSSPSAGGRHLLVTGSSTGKIDFQQVSLSGGTNLTLGLEVDSSVPAGSVSGQRNLSCASSITSPVVGSAAKFADVQVVSATGTTAIGSVVESVDVTANGAVSTELRDPTTMPEGRVVCISNASTQLGTTTVTTAAGSIVGSTSLAGAGATGSYKVFGATWRRVA